MLSKNTKTKHRRQRTILSVVRSIRVTVLDKRTSHFLISIPTEATLWFHKETKGRHETIKQVSRYNKLIWELHRIALQKGYPEGINDPTAKAYLLKALESIK